MLINGIDVTRTVNKARDDKPVQLMQKVGEVGYFIAGFDTTEEAEAALQARLDGPTPDKGTLHVVMAAKKVKRS